MRRLQIFGEEKPKTLTPPSAMDIEDRPIISEPVLPCQVVYSSQYWTMKGMDRYLSDRSYHVREIARRVPLTRQRVLTIWYLLLVWGCGREERCFSSHPRWEGRRSGFDYQRLLTRE